MIYWYVNKISTDSVYCKCNDIRSLIQCVNVDNTGFDHAHIVILGYLKLSKLEIFCFKIVHICTNRYTFHYNFFIKFGLFESRLFEARGISLSTNNS